MQFELAEEVPAKRRLFGVSWSQGEFFFGEQKRVATVTDVKFLSEHRLVVAHRAAAKVYLVDVSEGHARIVHSVRLKYFDRLRRRYFHPDLMALDGDTLYLTAYSDSFATARVLGDRLKLLRVQTVEGDQYHGCAVQDDEVLLGGVSANQIQRASTHGGSRAPLKVGTSEPVRIKMIGVAGEHYYLSLDRQVGSSREPGCIGDAWFSKFRVEDGRLVEVDSVFFERCQVDGAVSGHGLHFVSLHDATEECGYVVTMRDEGRLEVVRKTRCEDFPHGLDIHEQTIAYCSYATSSVYLRPLAEFLPAGHAAE